MCAFGRICVRSPLPSLVTMIDVPVSAMRKLAPVMPTSAARNFARSTWRASASSCSGSARLRSGGRSRCALRNSCSTSFAVRWIAGAMMWEGASPRNWMMYSPRSVSTGFDPGRLERVIEADLLGDHRLALGDALRVHRLAEVDDDLARLLGVLRVVHMAAALAHLALVGLEIEVEVGERVVLDRAGAVAQRLELGQAGGRSGPAADEIARERHRALQAGVGQRFVRVFLEMRRGRDDRSSRRLPSGLRRSPGRRPCRRESRRHGAP